MARKIIKPVVKQGNKFHINLSCSESNLDWIRAARLLKKTDAGDEEARKQFEEMDNTDTYYENTN